MDETARLSSKGQVTVPRRVRDALDLHEGDRIHFRVERSRAIVAKSPDFLELEGAVAVPPAKRGTPWAEVAAKTHRERASKRR